MATKNVNSAVKQLTLQNPGIFVMGADPKPQHAVLDIGAERAMMETDPRRTKPPDMLEVQRRVHGVAAQ